VDGVDAEEVARKAMEIAGDICVYTNHNTIVEIMDCSDKPSTTDDKDDKDGKDSDKPQEAKEEEKKSKKKE